jgi:hypothetical protein
MTEEDLVSIDTSECLERAEAENYYPSHHQENKIITIMRSTTTMPSYVSSNPVELDNFRGNHLYWELT